MGIADSFGKVAVLYGGNSAERDVSLKSGGAVCDALSKSNVDFEAIDATGDWMSRLMAGRFDRVFNALHGRGGEDGKVQGFLECLGLPYTGSGVAASAVAMDKALTKHIWVGNGIPTPKYTVITEQTDISLLSETLSLPLIVKPAHEGSSIGMTKVTSWDELPSAIDKARSLDGDILVEQCVTGSEYTVAVLNGESLPVIKLETDHSFYDYDAKYLSDDTRYLLPCGLSEEEETGLRALALKAFLSLIHI